MPDKILNQVNDNSGNSKVFKIEITKLLSCHVATHLHDAEIGLDAQVRYIFFLKSTSDIET
jgi:hypothetical protein